MPQTPEKTDLEHERHRRSVGAKHELIRAALAPLFAVALFTGYVGALATALGIIFLLGAFPELGLPRGQKVLLLSVGPALAVGAYAMARLYRRLVRQYVLSASRTKDDASDDSR